jgi:hypothetical protein
MSGVRVARGTDRAATVAVLTEAFSPAEGSSEWADRADLPAGWCLRRDPPGSGAGGGRAA